MKRNEAYLGCEMYLNVLWLTLQNADDMQDYCERRSVGSWLPLALCSHHFRMLQLLSFETN